MSPVGEIPTFYAWNDL